MPQKFTTCFTWYCVMLPSIIEQEMHIKTISSIFSDISMHHKCQTGRIHDFGRLLFEQGSNFHLYPVFVTFWPLLTLLKLICILIIWMNRVLKYEHFEGYFVVLELILPEIQWFSFPIPLNFGSKRASMSATVIAGLPKVYPNFLDVPHSVLQQCEEKFRAPLMHTGTPSA